MSKKGGSYSAEFKKGDIAEILRLLQLSNANRNTTLQKELVKRVCAYMSLGIDVSSLFSEMIMATNTRDLVQKKLVYMYLSFYVKENEKTALLAINTYHKDCRDENPIVRGLALRSLTSLKVPKLIEYILPMVIKALEDHSSYVRKTAAISAAKVYHISPLLVKESKIIDSLYDMIKDADSQVIANSLIALDEILKDEGGIVTTTPMILHLLSKLREFNEWHQSIVLHFVSTKYTPETGDDVISILNILDEHLNYSNYALVMAVVNIFLKYTDPFPSLSTSVLSRIKEPLITFMEGERKEIAFDSMKHILLLSHRYPNLFDDHYKSFYPIYGDPNYLNLLKISLLRISSSSSSSFDIISNLCGVIREDEENEEIIKAALECIGYIAFNVPSISEFTVGKLLSFLDLHHPSISSSSFLILRNMMRRYAKEGPEIVIEIKDHLAEYFEEFNDEGKESVLWVIETFSQTISSAPYLLQSFLPSFPSYHTSIQLCLITVITRMFFKTPGEMKPILSQLFSLCLSQEVDVQVRDRSLFYYRLLSSDLQKAAEIINADKLPISSFSDTFSLFIPEQVFEEFNTLSVVYNKPSSSFLIPSDNDDDNDDEDDDEDDEEEEDEDEDEDDEEENELVNRYNNNEININEFFSCKSDVQMTAELFQNLWSSSFSSLEREKEVRASCSINEIEANLSSNNIFAIASGNIDNLLKFYLYSFSIHAKEYILCELVVSMDQKITAKMVIKTSENTTTTFPHQIKALFSSVLSSIL